MTERERTFEQALDEIWREVRKTLIQRHSEYGSNNLERRGMTGIATRIEDKLGRIDALVERGEPERSYRYTDPLVDIAGYAVMGLILRGGDLRRPMETPKETQ